jgi:3-hydroxyisobutyrate dehydrogenase-like beta-hydroxyacid dehydrogenase
MVASLHLSDSPNRHLLGVSVPPSTQTAAIRIAFLGLGQMGAPIARLLLQQGHSITLWNRNRDKAQAIATGKARVAATPQDAVKDAAIVFTMLTDDEATKSVLFAEDREPQSGFIDALAPGAIHVTLSTISVALARYITAAHQERRQHHVAAPVFGRPAIAEQGKLWIVTSGAPRPLEQVKPLLTAISRGLTVVSQEPWQAHALKLGGNLMITAMIQTLSEAFVYAEAQGIDPALFHQAVNSALFQSPLYESYGRTILHPPQHPGATVSLGIKDTRLAREAAAEAGIRLGLADYLANVLERAKESGFANEDWAVGQYRVAQAEAPLHQEPVTETD